MVQILELSFWFEILGFGIYLEFGVWNFSFIYFLPYF